jgi:hypothetical protein
MSADALRTALIEMRGVVQPTGRFSDTWGLPAMPIDSTDFMPQIDALIQRAELLCVAEAMPSAFYDRNIAIVNALKITYFPQIMGNQFAHMVIALALQSLMSTLDDALGVLKIRNVVELPKRLTTDLRLASRRIEQSLSQIEGIDERIETIQRAYEAASNLPIVQSELEDAMLDVEKLTTEMTARRNELLGIATNIEGIAKKIEVIGDRATVTMDKVDNSYRAATSQGLAQAFNRREAELKKSMTFWVLCLVLSLAVAGAIGAERFPVLLRALSSKPDWGVVVANMGLAALGMAAPAWFAIVATKQISQRFKLAEDYGYKAAVSAAYEGYRVEAERQGDEFEKKLFNSTLNRLDEQPLRFVDEDLGATPTAELGKAAQQTIASISDAASRAINKAIERTNSKEGPKNE